MSWKLTLCTTLFALSGALAVAIPSVASPQDSPRGGQSERLLEEQQAEVERRLAANVESLRGMQGGWQLRELRSAVIYDEGREDVGFLVVSGEFMSIELHLAYFDEYDEMEDSIVQTGTYRLNFDVYGNLIANLLIGCVDTGDGFAEPQEPGAQSVFETTVDGEALTLLREDGSRYIFDRMATGVLTQRLYEETDWLPKKRSDKAPRVGSKPGLKEAPDERAAGDGE